MKNFNRALNFRTVLFAVTLLSLLWGYQFMLLDHAPVVFKCGIEDLGHAWFIPLYSLYILWRERRQIAASVSTPTSTSTYFLHLLSSLPFLLVSLFLGYLGTRGIQLRLEIVGFIGTILSLTWIFFGFATLRQILFPVGFLIFCLPLHTFLDIITIHLRLFAVSCACGILSGFGIDIIREGTLLMPATGTFNLDMADPCNGIRSLFAMLAITTAYAYLAQPTWLRRAILVVLSVPITIFANAIRIVTIVLAAAFCSPTFTTAFYNGYSSYVVFATAIPLILFASRLIKKVKVKVAKNHCRPQPTLSTYSLKQLAELKVAEWLSGVDASTFDSALEALVEAKTAAGEYRFKRTAERQLAIEGARWFFREFSRKLIPLSDGRFVYFAPDPRARMRNANNAVSWAEYAFHAVSSSGKLLDGKNFRERIYNATKAADLPVLESVIQSEQCMYRLIDAYPENDAVIFVGQDAQSGRLEVVTRLDQFGNAEANLGEVTVIAKHKRKENPPPKFRPLTEVVEAVAKHQAAGFSPSTTEDSIANPASTRKGAPTFSTYFLLPAITALTIATMLLQARNDALTLCDIPAYRLPAIPGYESLTSAPSGAELSYLPADTEFDKRFYTAPDGHWYLVQMVIGGESKSSIHRPEICLPGQGYQMLAPHELAAAGTPWHRITIARGAAQPTEFAYTFFNQTGYKTADHVTRINRDIWDRAIHNRIDRWVMITVTTSNRDEAAFADFLSKLITF